MNVLKLWWMLTLLLFRGKWNKSIVFDTDTRRFNYHYAKIGEADYEGPLGYDGVILYEQENTPIINGSTTDIEGNIYYFKDAKLHREDGPAVVYVEEQVVGELYFIEGRNLTKEEWKKELLIREMAGIKNE